jgi:hypothetical protein
VVDAIIEVFKAGDLRAREDLHEMILPAREKAKDVPVN